jgi:uncharacterized protein YicC (UPF0701 family)
MAMPRSEDEGRRLPLRIKRKTYYGKGAKDKAALADCTEIRSFNQKGLEIRATFPDSLA